MERKKRRKETGKDGDNKGKTKERVFTLSLLKVASSSCDKLIGCLLGCLVRTQNTQDTRLTQDTTPARHTRHAATLRRYAYRYLPLEHTQRKDSSAAHATPLAASG